MAKSTFTTAMLLSCLLSSLAQAELYDYQGSLSLSFPSNTNEIEFMVPLSGMVNRSATPPHGFEFATTQSFPIAETLTGFIPNPLPLMTGTLSSFESVFLGDLVLHPGTIGMSGNPLSGLDLAIESLEMLGTTVNSDFVTASLSLLSIIETPTPALGKLIIFNDSGSISQPLTAQLNAWSVATSNLDANGGTVSLVTPIAITTSQALSQPIDATARLQLNFAPEPGMGWMLGAGALMLAEVGRRRRKQLRS